MTIHREVPAGSVAVSASNFFEVITGLGGPLSATGVSVTTEKALGVPAVFAAVNFLAGTIAGLPIHVYQRSGVDRKRVHGRLSNILHDAANDETSSFDWRKQKFENVFTGGRGFTFIERNARDDVINLWPLDPSQTTVRKSNGRRIYRHKDGGRTLEYEAREILDIPFMLKADGVGHRGPIRSCRDAIGLAIAATDYGSRFFANGGVPPFAVTGSFKSGAAMHRATDDLAEAVAKAAKQDRQALTLPAGLDIKAIGADAEKSQLVETKRFCIEEIARVYSLPPTFLQDLSKGTFSNTEQQDLHFVKHTVKRWVEQFEQELNLKLFGRNSNRFAEINIDGLLRGDFKTRMDGFAQAIQNAVMTPNEARQRLNLPADKAGGRLMIQGATVPIEAQGAAGDESAAD